MIYQKYINGDSSEAGQEPPYSEPAAAKAYRMLERMIVMLELEARQCRDRRRADRAHRSRPHPGARGDPAPCLGRPARHSPARRPCHRAAQRGRLAASHRCQAWRRIVLARSAARFVTREAASRFHEAALAMQGAVVSSDVVAFLEADKAFDEAHGAGRRQRLRGKARRSLADA